MRNNIHHWWQAPTGDDYGQMVRVCVCMYDVFVIIMQHWIGSHRSVRHLIVLAMWRALNPRPGTARCTSSSSFSHSQIPSPHQCALVSALSFIVYHWSNSHRLYLVLAVGLLKSNFHFRQVGTQSCGVFGKIRRCATVWRLSEWLIANAHPATHLPIICLAPNSSGDLYAATRHSLPIIASIMIRFEWPMYGVFGAGRNKYLPPSKKRECAKCLNWNYLTQLCSPASLIYASSPSR